MYKWVKTQDSYNTAVQGIYNQFLQSARLLAKQAKSEGLTADDSFHPYGLYALIEIAQDALLDMEE